MGQVIDSLDPPKAMGGKGPPKTVVGIDREDMLVEDEVVFH